MKIKIGDLAAMTGCQVVTIRYYEKEGLLPQPERTGANYRLYDEHAVERLRFIRHCRQHGMNLSEIRALLAFKDNPMVTCDWINSLVATHLAAVDEQIASLQHLKQHLQALLHRCSGGKKAECGILESLNRGDPCPRCKDFCCGEAPADEKEKKQSYRRPAGARRHMAETAGRECIPPQ